MDWPKLYATLVGAGISVLTTIVMFFLSNRKERMRADAQRFSRDALLAFEGLHKLVDALDALAAVNSLTNEMFKEANEAGLGDLDPGVKLVPIVGVPEPDLHVMPKEILFLLRVGESGLYHEYSRFLQSVNSDLESIRTFNKLRRDFQNETTRLVLEGAEYEATSDLIAGRITLKGNVGMIHSARIGELNGLVGQFLDSIEASLAMGKQLVKDYHRVAKEHFKDEFPTSTITIKGEENANP